MSPYDPNSGVRFPFFDEVAKNFDGGQLLSLRMLALIALGVLLLLAAVWAHNRAKQHRHTPPPLLIFRQVARKLGLSLRDQWLLIRIARHQSLPSPITLLASPRTLQHFGTRYAQQLIYYRRDKTLTKIERLSDRLFTPDDNPKL